MTIVQRFVHLSDIHFGQEKDGDLIVHDDVRSNLLQDVGVVARKRGNAQAVLVVGDIAYSGTKTEYDKAGEWLDSVTRQAGCDETDVCVVPGNHDCDHDLISRLDRNAYRAMRDGPLEAAYADMDDAAKREDATNPLLEKFRAYRDFAGSYECDFRSPSQPSWCADFELEQGITLRLVGMNSALVSDKKDELGKLILWNNQYILPNDDPSLIYAVMMHHPPHWLKDRDDAERFLHNRARLMLFGHEHISKISKTTDELNNERVEIRSGATTPKVASERYRYAYNWIELALRRREAGYFLVVTVFPRVWVPDLTKFDADTQRLGRRESMEFEIACPSLKAAEQAILPSPDRPEAVNEGGVMNGAIDTEEQAAVAKLKFLFWRYLDWRQRLTVLVQADALPASANRPIPQTLERQALEVAQQAGKLSVIWDAMMNYLPDTRKQANPFTRAKG